MGIEAVRYDLEVTALGLFSPRPEGNTDIFRTHEDDTFINLRSNSGKIIPAFRITKPVYARQNNLDPYCSYNLRCNNKRRPRNTPLFFGSITKNKAHFDRICQRYLL